MTEGIGPRVRFRVVCAGRRTAPPEWRGLADALLLLERSGGAPVLPDRRVGGNAALRLTDGSLLVSRSGRRAGRPRRADFVRVVGFDPARWTARVDAPAGAAPSSDTPLYWAALVEAPARFGWTSVPRAAVHGHLLQSAAAARRLGIPVSRRATAPCTPADRTSLLGLLREFPWPRHAVWVRRGHGFFAAGRTPTEAFRAAARLWSSKR